MTANFSVSLSITIYLKGLSIMEEDKEKFLYRIFKEDALKRGMDMKDFYSKRKKGLLPFLNSKGEVEWLKRDAYRIAAVKKSTQKRSKRGNHHKSHTRHQEDNEIFITSDKYKYFLMGACTTILVYLFIKFLELLQIF
ncbi:MAG: hypothetical protein KAW87_05640 [Candidatus Cloacimonetes bacterium]|nr:hypothetical protein [Candidatus Cloacimonadota bacterium]